MKNQVLSWLTGVITDPVATMREVSGAKPVGWALAVYLAGTLLAALSSGASPLLVALAWPLFAAGGILLLAALFHLTAGVFGGRGTFGGMLSALGFAGFLYFLVPPLNLMAAALGNVWVPLAVTAMAGLMVWTLVLYVIAVKENYGVSAGMSLMVVLTPLILVGLGMVLIWFVVFFLVMLFMYGL